MEGFLRQVEDLLSGIWRGDSVLTLSGLHRVVFLPVIVGVEKLLKPLNEVQVVLKSPLDEFLDRDDLRGGETGSERENEEMTSLVVSVTFVSPCRRSSS